MPHRSFICLGVLALCLLGGAAAAHAYPQFQLSVAPRCSQCHHAPAGGGLINGYGRYAADSEISRGGDGGFLHGAWEPPEWLDLGADYRHMVLAGQQASTTATDTEVVAFPMQLDAYARAEVFDFSVNVTVGARGAARPRELSIADRFVSRDHYLMYQPGRFGWYARAGRYLAPYGLRLVEHTSFVRRHLGFGLLEETLNVGGGWIEQDSELHVTAFAPPPWWSAGDPGFGAAAYYERRADGGNFLWGIQALGRRGDERAALQVGATAKWWLPEAEVLFMAELDSVTREYRAMPVVDAGWVSYLSATWIATDGVFLTAGWEGMQRNVREAGTLRNAWFTQVQLFPWAHFELAGLFRVEPDETAFDRSVTTQGVLQLHYYL